MNNKKNSKLKQKSNASQIQEQSANAAAPVAVTEAADDTGNETPTGTEPATGDETPTDPEPPSKKKRKKEAFVDVYHDIYKMIDSATNDTRVTTRMLIFGYTPQMVGTGNTLFVDTKAHQESRDLLKTDGKLTTKRMWEKQEEADAAARDTMGFCSIIFKNDADLVEDLFLEKILPRGLAEWLDRYEKVYKRLLETPRAVEGLALLGVTLERLQAEQQMVVDVAALDAVRQQLKADAQDATQLRNKSFIELKRWVQDYRDVARVAFRDNEQLLEKLGILKRSPTLSETS
ncbi:MAG: hypothetical protein GY765_37490 [bacterium]|nr:hypothetical protein [bacterium]